MMVRDYAPKKRRNKDVMNKPQILMSWLNAAIRRALSRAMPTWREKFSWGVIAAAILLFAGWYWRYGGPWNIDPQKDAQLANGWVTNCSGPEFSKFSQNRSAGPGPARPVFKINDQLVLAVPENNRPSAGSIESAPRECRTIGDLPKVPYLYFVIQGHWSTGYKLEDVPLEGDRKRFLPDAVTVRIEREFPSTLSVDDQRQIDQSVSKVWHEDIRDPKEIGGLICGKMAEAAPSRTMGGMLCSGHRTPSDPDEIRFDTHSYKITPFLLLQADYRSVHYGGIHIYWQVWTLDVSHGRDIDQAIWNSLAEWNLVSQPAARMEQ
jgi:hypothetical protein